jgi:hypothetical protein
MLLCVGGSAIVVLYAPPTLETMTVDDFLSLVQKPPAIAYLATVGSCVAVLGALSPRYGHRVLLVNLMLCSLLGSITVLCSSIASKFLKLLASGDPAPLRSPVPYVVLPLLAVTAILQVYFLNQAMAHFDSTKVVPVYYITFTLCSICGGGVVIRDFWRFQRANALGFGCGVVLCFVGVFLITRRPRARRPPGAARRPLGGLGGSDGTGDGARGGFGIEPLPSVAEQQQQQRRAQQQQQQQQQGEEHEHEHEREVHPPVMEPARLSDGPSLGDWTRRVSALVSDTLDHTLLSTGDAEQAVDVAHIAFVRTSSLWPSTPPLVTPHCSPVLESDTSRSRLLEEGLAPILAPAESPSEAE